MKKIVSAMVLLLLLAGALTLEFTMKKASAQSSKPPATEWDRTYGGANEEIANSVVQTSDGGYAIAGFTASFSTGDRDAWLIKLDQYGNMEWNKTYGGRNADCAKSVLEQRNGGYAIVGYTESFGAGGQDAWLIKVDEYGNMEWNQTYGGTSWDLACVLVRTYDGGYAIAGHTNSFGAGDRDFWLIKLAPVEIPATMDIDPDALNLKSKGKWITCYIELPEGYNVSDIDVSTIMLNDTIPAELHPTEVGDYDNDSIPDLMVKFDRAEVISYILANVNMTKLFEERFMTITLTITGKLHDGTRFQGSDTIRIIMPMPRGIGKHTFPI